MSAAAKLPAIPDAEIQRDFDSVKEIWGAEQILSITKESLRLTVAEILAGDTREGFGKVTVDFRDDMKRLANEAGARILQFNTISASYFRGHRIAQMRQANCALFGGMSRRLLKFGGGSVTQFPTSSAFQQRVSETATA